MQHRHLSPRRRRLWLAVAAALLLVSVAGVATAAEFGEGEEFTLPAGQTVPDDLYVSAGTVIIDGRVEGDLVAFGGYIEVNGEVTGDLISMGAGIVINGVIGDDARVAGGGIVVNGSIGDDLMAAGGGAAPGGFFYPVPAAGRSIQQGVYLSADASVGGDAFIVGGTGEIAGTVGGDLFTAMNQVSLTGDVQGSADVRGNSVAVAESAQVGGTLTYETGSAAAVPPGVAEEVTAVEPAPAPEEPLVNQLLRWVIDLARALFGVIVLGALLLFLFPRFTAGAAGEMRSRPGSTLVYGVLVLLLAFPLSAILVGLAWLFWRALPGGLAALLFMLGLWGVLWLISPAITGLWLGQLLLRNSGKLLQLTVGAIIILVVARAATWIPFTGGIFSGLVLLASFTVAVGAIVAYYRARNATPGAALPAAPPTAPPAEEAGAVLG